MGETILDVKELSVEYRTDLETVYAVNKISFSLDKGETIGLVGETGAGKTTTAMAILGLLPSRTGRVTGGQVIFQGTDLLTQKEWQMEKIRGQKIAMIFQDPMTALNPVLTVGEQIREALELHNGEKLDKKTMEERVDTTLEMVGIPKERKKEYPYQFSGGMKQRVVIAMALICSPELLIADEPTTALDVTIQAQILTMICDLQRKYGTSVLMFTHDLGVIAETCDKVAVIYAGEVIEYGTLKEIFQGEDHHPYTRGLFDSIPSLDKEEKRLHPIEGLMPDPTDLPKGCSFSPRCPYCREVCQQRKPEPWVQGSHKILCHKFSEDWRDETCQK